MAAFPHKIIFFLVCSTLTHVAFSAGIFKKRDFTRWPKPRCKMYIPLDPDYNADCPNVTAPVCASNGHTFQNECFFCVEQREFHYHIKFEKYGKCD
uniref:Serine protease inhibitor Kazal-type 13 n=2 Tax=Pan troglodytes TaxID=9598 RepID=H2RBP6_PANTR